MKQRTKWISILAVALIGAAGMIGCESTRQTRSEPATVSQPQTSTVGWPSRRSGDTMTWSSLAYPTGDARTSAIGVEKGVPQEVRLNQPFDYTIVVTNLAKTNLEQVTVSEKIGETLKINGSDPRGSAEGDMMTWSLGTLTPGESRTIRVNGTAMEVGTVASCAAVTYNSLLCTTIPVVQPELRLTKTGPAEVLKCDDIVYTFVVTNTGTGSVENVRISDPLPQGLTTADGQRTINFTVPVLAAGESKEFKATVKASQRGRFANKATASGGGLEAASGEVVTVVKEPVLKVTKSGPERQFLGRASTYEITIANTGDGQARETRLVDPVPAGATFVNASDGGRLVEGRVVWDLGTIAPEGSKKVNVTFTRDTIGTLRNEATATAYCAAAASAVAQTNYEGIPAVLLEVVDIDDPIRVGDNETYVITVTNQGTAMDTNIRMTITLEEEQSFVSATGPTRATAQGRTITLAPLASLAPKAQATWRVVVRCNQPGDVRFTVRMETDQLGRPVMETEATNIYE